jgi:hypothetical protein
VSTNINIYFIYTILLLKIIENKKATRESGSKFRLSTPNL